MQQHMHNLAQGQHAEARDAGVRFIIENRLPDSRPRPNPRHMPTMNRLAAILPASNVLVDVDATSKKRAFEHAGLVFENQHAIARASPGNRLKRAGARTRKAAAVLRPFECVSLAAT